MTTLPFDPAEQRDNLHGPSRPNVHWSTDNVGEAVPGVLSPLSADLWGYFGEKTTRGSLIATGVLPKTRRQCRSVSKR
jgi:pyruvate,water dikinase